MNIARKVIVCLGVSVIVSLGGLVYISIAKPFGLYIETGSMLTEDVVLFYSPVLFVSLAGLLVAYLLSGKKELLRYDVVGLLLYHEMTLEEFEIFLDKYHEEKWFGNTREMVEFLRTKFKSELTLEEMGVVLRWCDKEGWSEGAWDVVKSLSRIVKGI